MKKKLCLLLICLLSLIFISCSEKEKSPEFQPPIKNLQWGMTIDEVLNELKLTEENIHNDNGKVLRYHSIMQLYLVRKQIYLCFLRMSLT